jgi:ATP-dependent exoDNAse (exonuclease V) beta subunit
MFQVLHSSAGAGKTHALVKHYLGHCLSSADAAAYRQVLALTFTNKAAGEMKERVIVYLEDLAKGEVTDARMRDLFDHLTAEAKVDVATIASRASLCLKHMLHHWSDVAISTIDSFTRRVVQPFARDLQLDHDLRMTTEEDHYRSLAVDALIAEAGVDPRITELLTETCLQLLHDERKWDPEKPLLELSAELSKESSIVPLQKLRELDPATITALADRLRVQESSFRRKVKNLGERALDLLEKAGVGMEEISHGKGGIHGYFKRLCGFTDEWTPPGPHTLKPIETGKWHSAKASASSIAALDRICNDLNTIFQEAEELRENEHRQFIIRRAILRELLPSFTLHELDLRLEKLKQENAVAFFSDLTRKVSEVVKEEPVPFIYERLGEKYRHFLIDEFQDTSLQQWSALLPLIDNALGSGGSALLVGDAKQAIYRWRNGEVRLFVELPNLFGRGNDQLSIEREATLTRNFVEGHKLAHNHRSASNIIEFNNNLFDKLKQVLMPDLRAVYKEHEQLVKREQPGLVHVKKLDKELKGEARTEAMLAFTMEAVEAAIADGFAHGDIAILVRSKAFGKTIASHLIAKGYSVVSPDGLQLSGDPVIEMLIDHLRFLQMQDPAAAARICLYQGLLKWKEGDHVHPFDGIDGLPDPVKLLREWRHAHGDPRLRTTLTALIGELAVASGIKPGEDAQVLALQNEAYNWCTQHGPDLGAFIEHWERSGSQRSVEPPENGQAVQVMTVHKAKGLQFPVVIVPSACMVSSRDHGERLWIDPKDVVPELDVALVRTNRHLKEAAVPEVLESSSLCTLDALDLLYVAFTRPEQRLYATISAASTDDVSKQLLEFIDDKGHDGQFISGDREPPWRSRKKSDVELLKDVSEPDELPIVLRMEAPEDWDPSDPDPYRSHGDMIHGLLAEVHTLNDLDSAIEKHVLTGDLSPDLARKLSKQFEDLLRSPELSPYFDPQLKVRSECSIISADGRTIRPDRVVEDDATVRVLDIKTGRPYAEHADQVKEYMRYLHLLTGKPVEGALLYVRDNELKTVEWNGPVVATETFS